MMDQMQEEKHVMEEAVPVGTIVCVVRTVLQRWYLIVTVALIAAMAAFVYSDFRYVPQYTTSTTFVVTSGGTFTTTYQNLSATTEAASVFTQILNSSLLRQKVTEETGITNFDGSITASVVDGTNLLQVAVRGSDARTVYLVTRAMIDNHHLVSDEVLSGIVLEVLEEPTIPGGPSNSKNTNRLMKAAALLGAAATACLLFLQAWTADRIRSRSEADRKLVCRVLGVLYHERKHRKLRDLLRGRKAGIVISNPLTSLVYTESIHKLSGRIDKLRRRGQRVVMVTSLLENEGKSTVAVNLALSWARKGRKVLLIDCDLRRPACHRILGISGGTGVLTLLRGESTLAEQVVAVPKSSLHVIPGGRSVNNASSLLSTSAMEELLRTAAAEYELVVVDTPPMGVTPDAECIGEYAHCAVLVARQDAADASELNRALQNLEKTGTHLLGCVLNNVYGASSMTPAFRYGRSGYGYGYGYGYGKYGRYGQYGQYGYSSKKHVTDDEQKGAL